MESAQYVPVGRVVSTFGVKGELKIMLDIDVPDDERDEVKGFKSIEAFFIERNGNYLPYFIQHLTGIESGKPILKLEGLDTLEAARELHGKTLFLPADQIEVDETPSRFGEIIGFQVIDPTLGSVGTIAEVFDIPMQELARITFEGREVLIPLHEHLIQKIDKDARKLHIALPNGLLDLNSLDED